MSFLFVWQFIFTGPMEVELPTVWLAAEGGSVDRFWIYRNGTLSVVHNRRVWIGGQQLEYVSHCSLFLSGFDGSPLS